MARNLPNLVRLVLKCAFFAQVLMSTDPVQKASCEGQIESAWAAERSGVPREQASLLYMRAALTCREAFVSSGTPANGAYAMDAFDYLGEYDHVLALSERVFGTAYEGRAKQLVAHAHAERGDIDRALLRYRESANLFEQTEKWREAMVVAWAAYNLAWNKTRLQDALEFAHLAVRVAAHVDPEAEQSARGLLVTAYHELGEYDAAIDSLDVYRDRHDADKVGNPAWELSHRAMVYHVRNPASPIAAAMYQDVLRMLDTDPRLREENGIDFARRVYLNLVSIELEAGELAAAAAHLDEARVRVTNPDLPVIDYYEARIESERNPLRAVRIVDALLDRGDISPDWQFDLLLARAYAYEKMRADFRALADYDRAIEVLNAIESGLEKPAHRVNARRSRRAPFERAFSLEVKHGFVERGVTLFERATARTLTEMLDETSELQTPKSATPTIFGRDSIWAFFATESRMYRLEWSDGEPTIVELARTPAKICEDGRALLANPDDLAVAQRLGAELLPDFEVETHENDVAYVVPDGCLHSIPIAALIVRERRLMETRVIRYAPSVAALRHLHERGRPTGSGVMIVGDPRGELPNARAEASELGLQLDAQVWLGQAVTGEIFQRASGAQLLHIAAHSEVSRSGARIPLAHGHLDAKSIVAGRIGPERVVLASCQSAVSSGAADALSLADAFLFAGTRQIVGTLWSIEDEPARRFMQEFYQFGGQHSPDLALARAQRAANARGEPLTHWAGFVFYGT